MKKSAAGNSQPGEYADAIMAEQENLLELPSNPRGQWAKPQWLVNANYEWSVGIS